MHTDDPLRIPLENLPARLEKRASSCGIPCGASRADFANLVLKVEPRLADPGLVLQYELCGQLSCRGWRNR
jgi:hypothetical protein